MLCVCVCVCTQCGEECLLRMSFSDVSPPTRSLTHAHTDAHTHAASQEQQCDLSCFEDPQCHTDDLTVSMACPDTHSHTHSHAHAGSGSGVVLAGWMHVLLHPVYQVQCSAVVQ